MATMARVPSSRGVGSAAVLAEGEPAEGRVVARPSVEPSRQQVLPAFRAAA